MSSSKSPEARRPPPTPPLKPKPGPKGFSRLEFLSLGCDKNLVDTEKFLAMLKAAGFQIASPGRGQAMLINTCSFIEAAKQESIDHILSAVARKQSGKLKMVMVVGCLVELYREELRREIPEVDLWLSYSELNGLLAGANPAARIITSPPHLSYLKIAEGCDRGCAFCVIPRIRGRFRSLPARALLEEAGYLDRCGVQELNLVAQDLCDYGKDTGTSLVRLLEQILTRTRIPWLRLFYLNPEGVTRELIELVAREKRLCKYLDLPFQHVSDPLLKAMGRAAREKKIRALVSELKSRIPGVAIRGTALVGFPGETTEDFARLSRFVEESGFDWLGVFAFSPQPLSRAGSLAGQIPETIALRRKEELEELWRNLAEDRLRSKIGSVVDLLVDSKSDLGFDYQGRTQAQGFEIDGVIQLQGRCQPGKFYRVKVTDSRGLDLVAEKI